MDYRIPFILLLIVFSASFSLGQNKGKLIFADELEATISNSSELKFKEIYYQKGGRARVSFPYYFGSFEPVVKDDTLFFRFKHNAVLKVVGDTTEYSRRELDGKKINPIINAHASSESSHIGYEREVFSNVGTIVIRFVTTETEHTDRYKITVKTEMGKLGFKSLLNTEIFLADGNSDGQDEIYVFTYMSETSELMIFKIYK